MKTTNNMTIFNMIVIMMLFIIFVTVQNVGVLKVFASWEDTGETIFKAISGESESEKSEILVVERFRVLLGLGKVHKRSSESPALAPAPAEARRGSPAPSPAPVSRVHFHGHHRLPRPRPMLPVHNKFPVQHKENSKRKIIIMSVFLSTGVVLVIVLLSMFLMKRRFNRQKKVATRATSFCSDEGGSRDRSKCVTVGTFASKISALEPEVCNGLNTLEVVESGGVGEACLAEEIISDHEYSELSKNDSDDQSVCAGDKVANADAESDPHLSEDESFHSFGESRSSSNIRLSNASIGSLSEPVDVFSPNQSNRSLGSPHNVPTNLPHFDKTKENNSNSDASPCLRDTVTPSIPPPPPPPFVKSSSKNSEPPTGLKEVVGNSLCSSPSTVNFQGGSSSMLPPPPPPPYPNKSGNSIRGPPTPPRQPPRFTPMGKDGHPLPKLKPLHWDKVRATPDRSMVWDQLRCSSFELDEETIESLFGYSLKTAFTNEDGKSKSPSPGKHVLEHKRLQNITILSKALNVTAEKVCEALVQGDGLCTQQLEALVKMEPTKEEEAKLSNYKGDIDELGSAEKLVKELLKIPHAFERVEAMLYKTTFDDDVVHLRNSFSMLEEACKELRSNRLFLKLLEAVLKTGNRMNVGTIRGGAKAFKLEALLKLADVKGTDGKTTLLHFVVQEIIRAEGIRMSESIMGQINRTSKSGSIEEKEDDYKRMGLELVSGLSNELHNVKRTASLDLDVLATSVSNLSNEMSKLQKLVNKDLSASNDDFVHVMKTFLSHVEYNLKELQTAENTVLLSVREITEYYHGDVSKEEVNPLRIFVVVRDFLGMLDQVCRELKTLKTPRSPNPLAPFR